MSFHEYEMRKTAENRYRDTMMTDFPNEHESSFTSALLDFFGL